MNCSRARFLVYAYLGRELPRTDSEALQRHIAHCGSCAARSRSARNLGRLLRTRLEYARAPIGLRERLNAGLVTPHVRPRYAPLAVAASILLLILPLVADQRNPRAAAASLAGTVAIAAPPASIRPVSRKMTGTFVCLQCEARHHSGVCPLDEAIHELGFCADNGETWRVMSADPAFTQASVGQTVTVEGMTFPESGFLRASRVGY
ncbi:MAG: zf-HC2 domain-containing protein [Thermoanaerobaculia bacterium]